jgi:hypothetical protein
VLPATQIGVSVQLTCPLGDHDWLSTLGATVHYQFGSQTSYTEAVQVDNLA